MGLHPEHTETGGFDRGVQGCRQAQGQYVAGLRRIAHALREHGREAMSKAYGIEMAKQGAGAIFGLGQDSLALADTVANYGMTLPNSRSNENEADLIGLELSARAGYNPNAAITLWNKMAKASEGAPPEFMSTHPASDSRIASLQAAIPKVMPLYQQAKKS